MFTLAPSIKQNFKINFGVISLRPIPNWKYAPNLINIECVQEDPNKFLKRSSLKKIHKTPVSKSYSLSPRNTMLNKFSAIPIPPGLSSNNEDDSVMLKV